MIPPVSPDPADHAMGLELQLEELNERRARAVVQHRDEDVARLDGEIAGVVDELAATAERLAEVATAGGATADAPPEEGPIAQPPDARP